MIYDVAIVGGGPAGLAAGLYGSRAGLKTVMFEKMFTGGQAATTYTVENYPGFVEPIGGMELTTRMADQAQKYGLIIQYEEIRDFELEGKTKKIITDNETYQAKTLILAMGAKPRTLGLKAEETLRGRGVSYCATCDGALYKDKTAAIVGGGDTAVEDALFLAQFAKKVYLIHRRDELRAAKVLQDRMLTHPAISPIWNSEVRDILAEDGGVTGISVQNNKTNQIQTIGIDGIFIAIGMIPDNGLVKDRVELDASGYIITKEDMSVGIPGVFAAGDARQKPVYQIVTAAADGAVAAISAQRYIIES